MIHGVKIERDEESYFVEYDFDQSFIGFPVPFTEVNYPPVDALDGRMDLSESELVQLRETITTLVSGFRKLEILLNKELT